MFNEKMLKNQARLKKIFVEKQESVPPILSKGTTINLDHLNSSEGTRKRWVKEFWKDLCKIAKEDFEVDITELITKKEILNGDATGIIFDMSDDNPFDIWWT